jgi:uncharacterized protein (DUF433 family)
LGRRERMQMQNCLIELNMRDEPVITGTGVTVACVLESLSSDDSIEKICSEHHLSKEQVHAALSYAEMTLPHSKHYKTLDLMLKVAVPDDGLDYSLLAENAGYFNIDSCPLHLLYKYGKRARHNSHKGVL